MAEPFTSVFDDVGVDEQDEVKFTRIEANMQTANIDGEAKEQYRWVITVDTETTWDGLTFLSVNVSNVFISNLRGKMRGGPEFELLLAEPDQFEDATWRTTREAIVGINEEGSKQCVLEQTWIVVTKWQDIWWEA